MKKVTIIYKFLPQWRVDFFNLLKSSLLNDNIELNLIYGKLNGKDTAKKDEVKIAWGKYVPNYVFKIGGIELYWQPVLKEIKNSDLIIAEQANKLLVNYYLMVSRKFNKTKFALWGHGLNLQDNPKSMANKFKINYSNQCDWWFAYTKNVKERISKIGFPDDKITIVQNSIDTKYLTDTYNQIEFNELNQIKKEYGIGEGPIGIYCGGMYKEKRLDFLLEACKNIKKKIPGFEMIFIGAGPEDFKIKKEASELKWLHCLGTKFNKEKVPFFKMSDVFLMPGLVGLAILDTFSMETPIVTTNYPYHSPEIEYLSNGVNGVMTDNSVEAYSKSVVEILENPFVLDNIKRECKKSSAEYTVEKMVCNFKNGIMKCLE